MRRCMVRPYESHDLPVLRQLFADYAASLDIDLSYQDFEQELAELPGKYAPPAGQILLALDASAQVLGCIAMRPLNEVGTCEMKRLYVLPAARGQGIAQALVEALIGEATARGYREMRLDSLPTMRAAISLYCAFGFQPIAPYYDTPVHGTVFLARSLA